MVARKNFEETVVPKTMIVKTKLVEVLSFTFTFQALLLGKAIPNSKRLREMFGMGSNEPTRKGNDQVLHPYRSPGHLCFLLETPNGLATSSWVPRSVTAVKNNRKARAKSSRKDQVSNKVSNEPLRFYRI